MCSPASGGHLGFMQMRAFWHSLNLCPVLKTFLLVQSAIMQKETILLWFAAMVALTTQLLGSLRHLYTTTKDNQIAKFMGPRWRPPGSCRPRWAPYRPHEPCYQGRHVALMTSYFIAGWTAAYKRCGLVMAWHIYPTANDYVSILYQ